MTFRKSLTKINFFSNQSTKIAHQEFFVSEDFALVFERLSAAGTQGYCEARTKFPLLISVYVLTEIA